MILFLDFDGVLHPVGSTEKQYFSRLPLLEKFLRDDAPCWQVVISSSWREYFTLQQLIDRFSPDLRNRIIGSTPADDDRSLHTTWGAQASLYPREVQIRHFLAQRGLNTENWVALDDMKGWFRDAETNDHLVLCNPSTGLTEDDLAQLRRKAPKTTNIQQTSCLLTVLSSPCH
jgi:hypothetical protein